MKKIYFLAMLITFSINGQSVFINEIHYDNDGTDVNEAIEIAGPAGTDLSTYSLVLYNGSSTQLKAYDALQLTGILGDQQNGFGTLSFAIQGIQNGGPDGVALAQGSTLIQFLSYEGVFIPMDGVAAGVESTDIGVEESGPSTLETESLQLSGTGSDYTDFSWQSAANATQGSINNEQNFDAIVLSNSELEALKYKTNVYPNPSLTGNVFLDTRLKDDIDVIIYNSIGLKISEQSVKNQKVISDNVLSSGIYFIQLKHNGNTITKKLIIK